MYPAIASAVGKLKSLLANMRRAMDELARDQGKFCKLVPKTDADAAISNPEAMPVNVPSLSTLEPFFTWIAGLTHQPSHDVQFEKGALLAGGHVDMCKQVVGPVHMSSFCEAVKKAAEKGIVKHVLMGNNVAFETPERVVGPAALQATELSRSQGIEALLELCHNDYGLKTLYLAGNCIDAEIMERLGKVMECNEVCDSLWLKRNPIGSDLGAKAVGRMLKHNKRLQVIDLHNTGLLDAGIANMVTEMSDADIQGSSLKHIHLGANGITEAGAPALAAFLAPYQEQLESLYLDVNRLGDAGMVVVCEVLSKCKGLKRLIVGSNRMGKAGLAKIVETALHVPTLELLDVGFYKSMRDLNEQPNNFQDGAVELLIQLVAEHSNIKFLKAENCGLSQSDCTKLELAVQERGGITLYANQHLNEPVTMSQVMAHSKEELSAIKNPALVQHIYSIYRNK